MIIVNETGPTRAANDVLLYTVTLTSCQSWLWLQVLTRWRDMTWQDILDPLGYVAGVKPCCFKVKHLTLKIEMNIVYN